MGKGDKKTKRGKIFMGTFGVRRRRKRKKTITMTAVKKKTKPTDVVKSKPAVKPKTAAETKAKK